MDTQHSTSNHRKYAYAVSRPRSGQGSGHPGVSGLSCLWRRACGPKAWALMFLILLLIYIPLNVVYMIATTQGSAVRHEIRSTERRDSLAVEVKDVVHSASDGKVDLVLTLDVHDLLRFLDNIASPTGAPTNNPLPRNTSIVLHNPTLCGNRKLDYFVYVHSSPANEERRRHLRETWANVKLFKKQRFRVVFLMGQTDDLGVQRQVKQEFDEHRDLVIGDFDDHYKNLTLKGIMGLHWASTYCSQAPFVIKADDDAFVNIFEVLKVLENYKNTSKYAVCPLWKDNSMPILRDPKKCMKWCVKYTEFPGRTHFPQYCAGLTYIMSQELVKQMYAASFSTPFFWIDDVYVTGLLTSKVKDVGYVSMIKNFTLKENVALEQYKDLQKRPTLQFVHIKNMENFDQFWKLTLLRLTKEELELVHPDVLVKYLQYPPKPSSLTHLI